MSPAEVLGKIREELTFLSGVRLDPLEQTDDNVFSMFDADDA